MPVPNDLTAEEEKLFGEHGVTSAGPGSEPVLDDQQSGEQQHGDRTQQQQQQPRDAEGKFVRNDEQQDQQQSQQQSGDQSQQRGGEQQGGDDQGQPKMVPHAALHAERLRVAEVSRRASLAEARLNALLTKQRGEEGLPEMPSLEENPAEYVLALEKRLGQFEQGYRQEQETRQIDTAITHDEDLFKGTVQDYDAASDYYVQSRARELLQFYAPDEARELMLKEARSIARESWSRGRSAAETVYNLAMARGYNPNAPQTRAC
jgi:hypothetical protein